MTRNTTTKPSAITAAMVIRALQDATPTAYATRDDMHRDAWTTEHQARAMVYLRSEHDAYTPQEYWEEQQFNDAGLIEQCQLGITTGDSDIRERLMATQRATKLATDAAAAELRAHELDRFIRIRTGERSSIKIMNTRERIAEMLAIVRRSPSLFGGGPIEKPAKARPAVSWKPRSVAMVWEMLQDGDAAGALDLADTMGAMFFSFSGGSRTGMTWAPLPVEGMPGGFVSARRCDGQWSVFHTGSMLALNGNGKPTSRAKAEQFARDFWNSKAEAQQAHALQAAANSPQDQAEARAAWLKLHSITTEAETAQPDETTDTTPAAPEPMVSIISALTGATLGTLPQHQAQELADTEAARQVSELIASATTAATIEHASDPTTEDDHQDATEHAGELATVDAEPCAMATTCDASSAGNQGSAPTHGHASSSAPHTAGKRNIWIPNMTPAKLERLLSKPARTQDDIDYLKDFKHFLLTDPSCAAEKGFFKHYSSDGGKISVLKNKFWLTNINAAIDQGAAHQAPQRATHDAHGQRIGQRVAGKSGHWAAVMFSDAAGLPSIEFEGPDGSRAVWSYATGRERMSALQAMARDADQDAHQTDQDDDANDDQQPATPHPGEYPATAPDLGQQTAPVPNGADEVPRAVTQGTRDNTAQAAPTVSELVALLQARGFHGVESRRRPGAVLLARRGNDYPLTYSNTTQAQRCIAKLAAAGVAASVRGSLVVVTGAMQPPAGAARTVRDIMPTDGEHISDPAGRWEAWITGTEPRACVLFYRADAFRPTYHYSYKTTDKAREALRRFADEAEAIATERDNRKAERRAKLDQPHGLAVGDVLRSSWGYDQTNTDYFEVTRVIGKRTVEVRKLAEQIEQTAWAQGNSVPVPGQYVGAPMRRQVDTQGAVNILHATYGRAYKMEPVATVAGVRCFSPSGWSSYA